MKMTLLAGLSALLFACVNTSATAESTPDVYPTPQKYEVKGEPFAAPREVKLQGSKVNESPNAVRELGKLFTISDNAAFTVTLDELPSVKRAPGADPEYDAYCLTVDANGIRISAHDAAGIFYGVQTLRQLIDDGKITPCQITDYADVRFRGSIEGFYGQPWSHEARKRQFEFYGQWKLNTYVYGPKDDPYHGFGNKWRNAYPAEQAEQMRELVKTAHDNHVNFYWAVHPGNNISWKDDSDIKACVKKFEMMYDLGVRSFAVFFDDIGGEGAKPEKQVELLNYVNREFIRKKGDVSRLMMCPTQYNQAWSGGNYLNILGEGLDQDINIMWTGPSVCSDIPSKSMDWINAKIKRNAFIWWNWPVTDYCRTRLTMGRTYGLDKANKGKYAGFASNPMDKPEASKIALFGIADYTWNIEAFDSEKTYANTFKKIYADEKTAKALRIFAENNSDQGPNGHGYRREESVRFKALAAAAQAEYKRDGAISSESEKALKAYADDLEDACEYLKKALPQQEPMLWNEIYPWILASEQVADALDECVEMISKKNAPLKTAEKLSDLIGDMNDVKKAGHEQYERTKADRWAKEAIACGTEIQPFIERIRNAEAEKLFDKPSQKTGDYKIFTNVAACKNFKVNREEKKYVRLAKVHEVIKLNPGDYLGIELPEGIYGNYIHLEVDNNQFAESGKIQISADGKKFEDFKSRNSGTQMQNALNVNKKIRFFKYINTSKAPLEFKFKQFKFDIPGDAFLNRVEAITDRDISTFYTVEPQTESFEIPIEKFGVGRYVFIADDMDNFDVFVGAAGDKKMHKLSVDDNAVSVTRADFKGKKSVLRFVRTKSNKAPDYFYELYFEAAK